MQKFWILGTETFAWNSSHRRGSDPKTQTQTSDSFRITPVQTHTVFFTLCQNLEATELLYRNAGEMGTRFVRFSCQNLETVKIVL